MLPSFWFHAHRRVWFLARVAILDFDVTCLFQPGQVGAEFPIAKIGGVGVALLCASCSGNELCANFVNKDEHVSAQILQGTFHRAAVVLDRFPPLGFQPDRRARLLASVAFLDLDVPGIFEFRQV